METVEQIYLKWERTGELSPMQLDSINEMLAQYLDIQFSKLEELTESDPEAAFDTLASLTNFISAAASKVPGIMKKFQKSINKYQAHAKIIGQKLGAKSLTIQVGFPWGISLALTWDI